MKVPKLVRGFTIASALTGLVVAGAAPAAAHDFDAEDTTGLAPQQRGPDTGRPALLAAVQRDLQLSRTEAEQLIDSQAAAIELEQELEAELGSDFGGSWFDFETGTLTVGVTDSMEARLVAFAGAEVELVEHSEPELAAIVEDLDELAELDPQALAGATAWGIDTPANQVVLTVPAGQADEAAPLLAEYGDAVRVEESGSAPALQNHPFLDGGIPYSSPAWNCSVGFNVHNVDTGATYFLTAGHCHDVWGNSSSHGLTIGPAVGRRLTGADDALVRNDNPGGWIQGPWVWQYPGFVTVNGQGDPAVGALICKAGRTTEVTCGQVTRRNETVTFSSGRTINGLIRTDACTEGGDSGGATYLVLPSGTLAAGTHVGGRVDDNDRCLEVSGGDNVSWFNPLSRSMPAYQNLFGIELMTG